MSLIANLVLIAIYIMAILGLVVILLGLVKSLKHRTVEGHQGSIAILLGISSIVIAYFFYHLVNR